MSAAKTVGLAAALLAILTPRALAEPRGVFALPVVVDARDAGAEIDLRSVSFVQRRTQLWIKVRAHRAWRPAGGEACFELSRRKPVGRLCFAQVRGRSALRLQRSAYSARTLRATVTRPDRRTVLAHLHPRDLGLGYRALRWALAAPGDRVPDRGTRRVQLSSFGAPACFGAAARARRCVNPQFLRSVTPSPRSAPLVPDAACRPRTGGRWRVIVPCAFGHPAGAPVLALIGESHTAHWRAAVDVATRARGWPAVSLTRSGCSFSTETYPAPSPIPARCRTHTHEAVEWLRANPSVHTVVTSDSAGRGLSAGGFMALWRQLPDSVRRIYVIRDVPRVSFRTADCVSAVARRRGRTDRTCTVGRAGAFPTDAAAQAARSAGGRVRLLDFTRFFCGGARCHPVVGGVFVYRDDNHMNSVFSATLGPYLLAALQPAS